MRNGIHGKYLKRKNCSLSITKGSCHIKLCYVWGFQPADDLETWNAVEIWDKGMVSGIGCSSTEQIYPLWKLDHQIEFSSKHNELVNSMWCLISAFLVLTFTWSSLRTPKKFNKKFGSWRIKHITMSERIYQ